MYKCFWAFACVLYLLSAITANVHAEETSVLDIATGSVTLMDADTGIVLYELAQDAENYPASITKIMTALLTLELCDDLNERVTFSKNAVFSLPRDASHIAMDEGESLTVYDALHGLLLASANEVANALAEHLAGSTEAFAELMNKRAAALGAHNTHFENPSGLFEQNHQTTAYDMALIMREATKHELFTEIIAKRRYDIAPTEKQPEIRELLNSNQLIQPGDFFNEWVVGGKTGYTDEAMHTLVTYAQKDGRALIVSAMHGTKDGIYEDTARLFDYGFNLPFESQEIFDNEAYVRTVPVLAEGGQVGQVTVKSKENLMFDLPQDFDMANVRYDLDLPATLDAPVMLGDEVGTLTCFIQDVKVGEAKLTALNAVYAPEIPAAETVAVKEDAFAQEETAPVFEAEVEPVMKENVTVTDMLLPKELLKSFGVPIGLTLFMVLMSIVVFAKKRKRKNTLIMSVDRYIKGNGFYRYK